MKVQRNKTLVMALVLMLTIAVSLVALPAANAKKATYAFVGAIPNPVGVGQPTLIHLGITESLKIAGDQWKGLTVTVTKPDGTTETLGPFNTDSTGGTGTVYVPAKVGNYTLQTHFPAQWYNTTYVDFWGNLVVFSEYYEASDSDKLTLIVQEEPIQYYPGVPLPTEYWTRPIDAQAREWYTIAGNWPYTPDNRYAPYNDGPETAHILWTKPLTMGGLVGGDVGLNESINQGPVGFGIGDAYEGKWFSRIILGGRLYYAERAGGFGMFVTPTPVVYHCVDLHTGEEYWAKTFLDNQTIAFGQLLYWQTYNYMGTFPYLWVTTGGVTMFGPPAPENWYAFDAYTGDWRFTIKNMPSGTTLRDASGKLYRLQVDPWNRWMALWNMTVLCTGGVAGFGSESWGNSVTGQTFDAAANTTVAKAAWVWNKTMPVGLPGSVQATYFGDRIIGTNLFYTFMGGVVPTNVAVWGVSLKKGQEGTLLFNTTWAAPTDWIAGNQSISWAAWSQEDKVGVLWSKELRQHYGVSLETGEKLWGPTPSQYYLDMYEGTQLTSHLIAYGKLYACGVSGIVYCYNVTTGKLLWTYAAEDPYTEILWANNWWLSIPFITDGKLYVGSGEHSPNQPLPRGAPFLCLNATTGDEIFRINGAFRQTGWGGIAIIGDSVIATMDTYDQRVYAIGRGPSATTVEAPTTAITQGSSVVIRGTVTDVSPGTNDPALKLRFPNGVPAIADESMSAWMLYVYKQFPHPADAVGVPVTLDTVDPNGNWIHIGTVTSDASGLFSYMWTPEIPGPYKIIATFIGTESYYASYAQTAIGVEAAPPPPAEAPAYTGIDLAIIAAVAVVAILVLYDIISVRKLHK